MQQYIIVWSHVHGADVVHFQTDRDVSPMADDQAFEVLEELGCDIDPERREEYIEYFGELSENPRILPTIKGE